jgi:hypothetical protein
MNTHGPFVFQTERRLVKATGRKAKNLDELLRHLRQVRGSSIFYHTHHQYLAHHFEKPTFHNDFSIWAAEALRMDPLSEELASIDLLEFGSVRQLREAIIRAIEKHAADEEVRRRSCLPGELFFFCESQSFIMPTGAIAMTPPGLFEALGRASTVSLYFHFFEARLRLRRRENDFSRWLRWNGAQGTTVAERIERINPYVLTLDELKQEILKIGDSVYGPAE